VQEGDLDDETRPAHEHLVDLVCPVGRTPIAEQPVEAQTGQLALDAGADPRLRFRERRLPRGHVEIVIVAGCHDVLEGTDRLDLGPQRRVDRAGRVRQE
jgi:hypothetical protein